MATLALADNGARIARLGNALQAVAQEGPTNAAITVTIDNAGAGNTWTVTGPSGIAVKV
jgi:hypothetical protein